MLGAKSVLVPILAGAVLALAACATSSTPYQPVSSSNRVAGGYSEARLAPDRYRVTFAGNTWTSRDTVEGYLLYRAAELTVEQGFDWFEIVNRETEHRVDRSISPSPLYHPWYGSAYLYWQPYWRYYGRPYGWRTWYPDRGDPFWANRVDMQTVERFEATAEIVMRHGARPADDGQSFDARDVIEKLSPRIQRPRS